MSATNRQIEALVAERDALKEVLERLRDATAKSTNTVSADSAFAYVRAVAADALERTHMDEKVLKGGPNSAGPITPPYSSQRFDSFEEWVDKATQRLTGHPSYNDTEHGGNGWRGHHFKALCFDSLGRRCKCGADFMLARDEGTFPVWWIWPDQIPGLLE